MFSSTPSLTDYQHKLFCPDGIRKENIPLSTQLIIQEAESMGITWSSIPGTRIIELTHGKTKKYFYFQIPSGTTQLAFYACLDKGVARALLKKAAVSTPNGFKIERGDSQNYRDLIFNSLKKPLVVKPSNGKQGWSVMMSINSKSEFDAAVDKAISYSLDETNGAIVEETFQGKEYRVILTDEKVLAVMHRMPANIVGDSRHSVQELIDIKNSDPRRNKEPNLLARIEVDSDVASYINEQGFEFVDILPKDKVLYLKRVSNISQGGDNIDFTDKVHPSVKKIALRAIRSIPGLKFAGVDILSSDITRLQNESSYVVLEINSSPAIDIHELPFEGKKRKITREFLLTMFPKLKKSFPETT